MLPLTSSPALSVVNTAPVTDPEAAAAAPVASNGTRSPVVSSPAATAAIEPARTRRPYAGLRIAARCRPRPDVSTVTSTSARWGRYPHPLAGRMELLDSYRRVRVLTRLRR